MWMTLKVTWGHHIGYIPLPISGLWTQRRFFGFLFLLTSLNTPTLKHARRYMITKMMQWLFATNLQLAQQSQKAVKRVSVDVVTFFSITRQQNLMWQLTFAAWHCQPIKLSTDYFTFMQHVQPSGKN